MHRSTKLAQPPTSGRQPTPRASRAPRRSTCVAWAAAAASTLLLVSALPAAADASKLAPGSTTINFDDLPSGTWLTNQYPAATFSSPGSSGNGVIHVVRDPDSGSSPPNTICSGQEWGPTCISDVAVSFTRPVDGLRFTAGDVQEAGTVADIDVYENGSRTATVPIVGQGAGYPAPPLRQDLSAYHDVTKIVIRDVRDDPWGIAWDDFTFVAQDGPGPDPCDPPRPEEVVIYEHAYYEGRCVVKGIGRYDSAAAFAALPDDSASSIRVGEYATAVLASDNKLGGDNERFISDDPDLGDNGPGEVIGDNRMSSFEVQRKDCGASEAGVLECFVATRDRHGIADYLATRSIARINDEVAALDPSVREQLADVVLDYPAFTLPAQRRRGRLLAAMGEAFSKHQLGFLAEVWSYTPIETRPGGGGEFYPDSGKVVVGHDVDEKVLRNTLVHETFHAFNQHEDGPPDSLNEGSAIWVFKEAFGSTGVAQNWAEATYGTKLYYRDHGNPDYRLEAPANPTQKLVDEFRYLSSKDESRLPWHSQHALTYCYERYWEPLRWGQPTWDEWLAAAEIATTKMLSDAYCADDRG
jgi:hypothetical protein